MFCQLLSFLRYLIQNDENPLKKSGHCYWIVQELNLMNVQIGLNPLLVKRSGCVNNHSLWEIGSLLLNNVNSGIDLEEFNEKS